MFNILSTSDGRDLCINTSWSLGHNFGFKDLESFTEHCNQLVVESGSEEFTIYHIESWEPVAYLNVTLAGSYHRKGYGLRVDVSAVRQDHIGDLKLAKFLTNCVKRLAVREGCSWYERSKHISPNVVQTIIKEI